VNHRGAARGLAVGTEPTQNFVDISFVATVLEAAKFTPIRHARRHDSGTELLIWGSDLRRYRRQPEPDTAVVVVLDHTARREWDWTEALAPYLRWAYAQRSAVTIVESGHADCADELRAEAYTARTVLDPRVTISLNRPIGRATPLAHALELGVHELRRQLRRSTAPSARAWFVVASDGRGNVPLEASLRGQVAGHVGREGVTDALSAVAPVRSLPPVRRIVLAPPELNRCADLPFELADAMGGMVAEVEP